VHSFDGETYDSVDGIRDGLYRQLFNPVRWSATVAAMIGSGTRQLCECGPGKVLAGLARREDWQPRALAPRREPRRRPGVKPDSGVHTRIRKRTAL
jgi:[acyl-carrier-protein] S-malonyltransferase